MIHLEKPKYIKKDYSHLEGKIVQGEDGSVHRVAVIEYDIGITIVFEEDYQSYPKGHPSVCLKRVCNGEAVNEQLYRACFMNLIRGISKGDVADLKSDDRRKRIIGNLWRIGGITRDSCPFS